MKVTIYAHGTLAESHWRDACGEYARRLSPFCKEGTAKNFRHFSPFVRENSCFPDRDVV